MIRTSLALLGAMLLVVGGGLAALHRIDVPGLLVDRSEQRNRAMAERSVELAPPPRTALPATLAPLPESEPAPPARRLQAPPTERPALRASVEPAPPRIEPPPPWNAGAEPPQRVERTESPEPRPRRERERESESEREADPDRALHPDAGAALIRRMLAVYERTGAGSP